MTSDGPSPSTLPPVGRSEPSLGYGGPLPVDLRKSYVVSRVLFLRGMGIVYLIAFVSLWVQIDGLIGSRGILPARLFLNSIKIEHSELSPLSLFFQLPTLCWFNGGDGMLHFLCGGGALMACLLIVGIAPIPVLFLLWLFYLSLVNVGQVFLGYQWDALLLEAGFLSIFLAPFQLRLCPALFPRRKPTTAAESTTPQAPFSRPPLVMILLTRWLLFRLLILSGLVKWLSGDVTWHSFTALRYHYQTQPLPTWTSWYIQHAPNWFHTVSVGAVFFIEIVVPVLLFAPRRVRLFACAMIVFLQLLIAATGNYGFFNLLTIVLCVAALDDAVWAKLRFRRGSPLPVLRREWPEWVVAPLAAVIVLLSIAPAMSRLGLLEWVPRPLVHAFVDVAPFDITNAYGLFAKMTTDRPELIIEGSDDGMHWLPYGFKWKPGDLRRTPRFCTPHMPRLDWQMWFAALDLQDTGEEDPWLRKFVERLHDGSPEVLALLQTNPFPDHPPRYVRVVLWDYQFTTAGERRADGAWWQRVPLSQTPLVVGPGSTD